MKKTHRILGLFAALLLLQLNANQMKADNVDKQTARELAATFMAAQTGQKSLAASDLQLVYEIPNTAQDLTALYFFNTSNGGFVVVSGSDCLEPVIAYSTESVLDPEHIAPAMLWYLGQFADAVSYCQNNHVQPTAEVAAQWQELRAKQVKRSDPKTIYANGACAAWDQGYPFNAYSPILHEYEYNAETDEYVAVVTEQAPTGCVATAMAMIIHHWKYPVQPKGKKNHTTQYNGDWITTNVKFDTVQYDYSLMPDTCFRYSGSWDYTGTMYLTPEQVHQVAQLSYHCGITTEMGWGIDGSGTQSTKVPPALKNHFKYDASAMREVDRTKSYFSGNAGSQRWIDTLARELKEGRPIYYSGYDRSSEGVHAGHAFVLERYNSSNKRGYFNWGWGAKGGNCWCDIINSQLNVGGYTFSANHYAILGIQPPRDTLIAMGYPYVGIDDVEAPVELQPAYPNPTREWINIPYSLGANTEATLEIFAVDGRLMERRPVYAGTFQACVNVANYPKGMYIYRIGGVTRKFIVE